MTLKNLIKNIRYLSKVNLKAILNQEQTILMLQNLKYEIYDEIRNETIKLPKVKNRFITLQKILNTNSSVCRYGDGEFEIISKRSIHFQEYVPELATRLENILKSQDDNVMVCIADFLGDLSQFCIESQNFARNYLKSSRDIIYNFIDFEKQYYDACVTRPYINYIDKSKTATFYSDFKKVWDEKDIVIIEGSKTKMGVGNDLLDNTNSIQRIIAPEINAFSKYTEILNEAQKAPKDRLFLISLGPTATVLAYDLSKLGYRAIDTGHLDIEYEWFLSEAKERTKIEGKYVLEAKDGINVNDINDEKYENQIITRV